MAQKYKFFNSGLNDPRIYQAADFADYFGSILSTGLLHTDKVPGMAVSVEPSTLNTVVSAGKAIMKGHLYENTTPLTQSHSVPEPDLDRIDRIVLRLDLRNAERNILLHVKEGVSATEPTPPELQRDNFIYEISLAHIRVRANTSSLQPADLIDERLNEQLCGLVYSLISIPTDQFQAQWDLYFNQKKAELQQATDNYEAYTLEEQQRILEATNDFVLAVIAAEQQLQADLASFNQQWIDWFSNQKTEGYVLNIDKGVPGGVAKQDDFAAHEQKVLSEAEYGHVRVRDILDIVGIDDDGLIETSRLGNVQYLKDFYGRSVQGTPLNVPNLIKQNILVKAFDLYFRQGNGNGSPNSPYINQDLWLQRSPFSNYTSTGGIREEATALRLATSSVTSSSTIGLDTLTPIDITPLEFIELDCTVPSDTGTRVYIQLLTIGPTGPISPVIKEFTYTSYGHPREIKRFDVSDVVGEYYIRFYITNVSASYIGIVDISGINYIPLRESRLSLYPHLSASERYLYIREGNSEELSFDFRIVPSFLDWFSLNSLTDIPNGANIRFDIYDPHGNPVKLDVKNGETFENFADPLLKVKITLSRESPNSISPKFYWLEMGLRGLRQITDWEPIGGSVTLLNNSSEIRIALPEEYKEFRILITNLQGTTTTAANLYMRANNDATANIYAYTTVSGTSVTNTTNAYVNVGSSMLRQTNPGYADINILNYPGIGNLIKSEASGGAGNQVRSFVMSNWNKPDKIREITLYPSASELMAGATIELWGR